MSELVTLDRSREITRDWVALMAPAIELAKQVAGTSFVPQGLRNDPPAIVACILYGDEIGLGPMQSLAKIAMINGRPTVAAESQRGKILADGHELWVVEATVTRVTVAGRRRGSQETTTVTWTMDDAKRAGLAGKQNWKLYPRQMLLARASAELARLVFADSIGGLAATEEIEDTADLNGDVAVEPKPATTRRKRERAGNTTVGETSPPAPSPPPPERPLLPDELPTAADLSEDDAAKQKRAAQLERAKETKLNLLVGRLRERFDADGNPVLTTMQVWVYVANLRSVADVETLIELHGGRDLEGVLHWSPLRETMTPEEKSELIERLERYEQNLGEA